MASEKVLESKQATIDEIAEKVKGSESVILFRYAQSTVADMQSLRKELKNVDSEVKVYKNTLVKRALDSLNLDLAECLNGPSAMAYSTDSVAPIKTLSDFAKDHPALEIKGGIVDGKVTSLEVIKELSTIPSREGLLTMLAGGLIEHVRNLSIALNLYAEQLGEENK